LECFLKGRAKTREWRDRLIGDVFDAYGGPVCKCCGETEFAFLSLDHIGGGGNRHRIALRKASKNPDVYNWVKKNKFPPGFQVLCMNCNWAIGKFGFCPHQKAKVLTA
jgi:hypothetical protein